MVSLVSGGKLYGGGKEGLRSFCNNIQFSLKITPGLKTEFIVLGENIGAKDYTKLALGGFRLDEI